MLFATRDSAVAKKPRLRLTISRSSSVSPSLDFHRAMSACMLTSVGIQWLLQAAKYFSHAQRYLSGSSWLTSARELIIRLSSTSTRAAPLWISPRPVVLTVVMNSFPCVVGEVAPALADATGKEGGYWQASHSGSSTAQNAAASAVRSGAGPAADRGGAAAGRGAGVGEGLGAETATGVTALSLPSVPRSVLFSTCVAPCDRR